jgi:DNA polymerase-3 subunit alpha
LLTREGRGRGRVILVPRLGAEQEVEIALPGGFNVGPRLMQAMRVVPGVAQVEEF